MAIGRLAGRLSAAWALWRLLGRRPSPRFPGRQERPAAPTGRTVIAGRHEFFVREAGPPGAPPVLLIHGWAFDSLAAWHRIIPLLAEHLRVTALDLRGHGKSDRIRGRCEVEDLADDLAAALDVIGAGRTAVVGYSLGGLVAQALARRHPARVERLALVASAADPSPLPRPALVGLLFGARAFARLDPTGLPRLLHHYLVRTGAIPPEHSSWLWESLVDRDADLHHEAGFAIARFDSRHWAGRLGVPVLCVVPSRDQLIPPARQRATAAMIPGARLVEIEGARHEAVFTHPAAVAAAVLRFVAPEEKAPGAGRGG